MTKNSKELLEETEKLNKENAALQQQLREAKDTINLIKTGNIDALVDSTKKDIKVYTDKTADKTYRILIEKMHEGAVTLNEDGTILYCNSCFANMVNLPLQKVIGTKFKNFIVDASKERFDVLFQQGWKGYIKDGGSIVANDGKSMPVMMSINSFELDNNFVLSIILTDLTIQNKNKEELNLRASQLEHYNIELESANKELAFQNEEKEKRAAELRIANKELAYQNIEKEKRAVELRVANYARGLIEASLDPLLAISPEGKITDVNQAAVKITGISRGKLKGTDFFNYFTEPQKAREVYQEVYLKGFVANSPFTISTKKGKLLDVLLNGSVYKDNAGNVLGIVLVARDVTKQKRIENELIEAKVFAELATLIAEEAKSKAEEAVKAKQQFLSNMSHEIRTPMNAIIGFTKVLSKTDLSIKQKEYLEAIKMSGDSLIVLINDILDLAKVDAGKMVFEQTPFKIVPSITSMLHLFEPKIHEKNLKLVKELDNRIPKVLIGDEIRLDQIILNLVSNAVKFTTKGKITVSVHLLHENDDKVTLEFIVTDTGIGIAQNKLETIFENFQQAHTGTSKIYGGTGLGLAIVKKLVEAQGGTIHVISEVDKGSTFSFTLAFQKTKEEPETIPETIELDSEIKNIKVLVVEDMALNQLLMKTLLDDFGFERDIADNGKIALEKLQHKSYDIILMDLQMPVMDGFETTDYIRNTMHSNIPIIALTADVTTVDLTKCKSAGMNDYISKPINERLLYSKIVGLIKTPVPIEHNENKTVSKETESEKTKYVNLDYLNQRTKSNPKLMLEMIALYLEHTPPLISSMKQSLKDKDWDLLQKAVHKMIPSFSIMGISPVFENIAKKIQEYASTEQQTDEIPDLVLQLDMVCTQVYNELEEEMNAIKNMKS